MKPSLEETLLGSIRTIPDYPKPGILFRDINFEPDALAAYGASLEDVRKRLHATDLDGRLLVGADVAVAMWRATPGDGWLAALFGNALVLPLTRLGYDAFAKLLYRWNRAKGHW